MTWVCLPLGIVAVAFALLIWSALKLSSDCDDALESHYTAREGKE